MCICTSHARLVEGICREPYYQIPLPVQFSTKATSHKTNNIQSLYVQSRQANRVKQMLTLAWGRVSCPVHTHCNHCVIKALERRTLMWKLMAYSCHVRLTVPYYNHVSDCSVRCTNETCMSLKTTTSARLHRITYVYTHTHTVLMGWMPAGRMSIGCLHSTYIYAWALTTFMSQQHLQLSLSTKLHQHWIQHPPTPDRHPGSFEISSK